GLRVEGADDLSEHPYVAAEPFAGFAPGGVVVEDAVLFERDAEGAAEEQDRVAQRGAEVPDRDLERLAELLLARQGLGRGEVVEERPAHFEAQAAGDALERAADGDQTVRLGAEGRRV